MHHFLGFPQHLQRAQIGLFQHDKGCHGKAVGGNNAGDDEQHGPKGNEQTAQEVHNKGIQPAVHFGKQILQGGRTVILQIQQKFAVTQLHCAADGKIDHAHHQGNHGHNGKYTENSFTHRLRKML